MKLKRLPEDFQVEELTELPATKTGEFAFYRFTKRGLGTPEAVDAVVERWKLAPRQISFGGMKDRHAVTTQFLTIHRGPRRDLRQTNLELEYLGQAVRPFTPAEITGNRFRVVVRSLDANEMEAADTALAQVGSDGVPNYFDDQRFGSLGESGEFVAQAWIAGDYERTLWLALAEANPLDRPRDREEKSLLREHWGEWATCSAKLRGAQRRCVVEFLANRPGDFRGAITRIPAGLRGLYLAALQSHLWNRLLVAFLVQNCRPEQLTAVNLKTEPVPFCVGIDDATRELLRTTSLPLPSSRMHLDEGPIKQLVDRSLAEVGLALREIRVKYPRDSFFSKGWRPACFFPAALGHETADDELYPGRRKLSMSFDLPRGSYATMLIKRVTVAAGQPEESSDEDAADHEHEETEASAQ